MGIELMAFVPLGVSFYFAYLASTLEDKQIQFGPDGSEVSSGDSPLLKWFFRLISLTFLFPAFAAYNIVVNVAGSNYTDLSGALNINWITWVYFSTIALLLIVLLAGVLLSVNKSKVGGLGKL